MASAESAGEGFNLGYFARAAYDVIIFKFQGGGQLPQVAPSRIRHNLCSG